MKEHTGELTCFLLVQGIEVFFGKNLKMRVKNCCCDREARTVGALEHTLNF